MKKVIVASLLIFGSLGTYATISQINATKCGGTESKCCKKDKKKKCSKDKAKSCGDKEKSTTSGTEQK